MIDEAHKNSMEVHAYFEKSIKIDKNSPIFDLGIDRTYAGVDYLLNKDGV